MSWSHTGIWHTEPCGCVYSQQVETGGDYHERWTRLLSCPRHFMDTWRPSARAAD